MLLQIPLDIPDLKIEKFDASSKKGFVGTVISGTCQGNCRLKGKKVIANKSRIFIQEHSVYQDLNKPQIAIPSFLYSHSSVSD